MHACACTWGWSVSKLVVFAAFAKSSLLKTHVPIRLPDFRRALSDCRCMYTANTLCWNWNGRVPARVMALIGVYTVKPLMLASFIVSVFNFLQN